MAMDNKHYWAPIDNPTRILDIGTGTGIWAMEIGRLRCCLFANSWLTPAADQFPDAYVS
jgi:hypothetical protein